MNKDWSLTGGAIIIGSLLWQDHLNNQDNTRKNWRNDNLDEKSKIMVKLPIRYGRYSSGCIYTMVFSNNCQRYKKLGTGYISQFKSNPIKNFKQLLLEVKAMSKAEGMNGNLENDWGKVTILFNPDKINPVIKKQILLEWRKLLEIKNGSWKNYKLGREKTCVNSHSELNIKWPYSLDNREARVLSQLDFLIATATKPKHKTNGVNRYPKIQEIVTSVDSDTKRFYFINNLKNGITTFQDNTILNELQPRNVRRNDI